MNLRGLITAFLTVVGFSEGYAPRPPVTSAPIIRPPVSTLTESSYRIPFDLQAISYDLSLEPDLSAGTFLAEAAITLKPHRPTRRIILNSKFLKYENTSLEGKFAPVIVNFEENMEMERIIVTLSDDLYPGGSYAFKARYHGIINQESVGLFYNSYEGQDGEIKKFITTQLRPVYARRLLPCFDEPSYRAVFRVSVVHDAGLHALSSTPVLSKQKFRYRGEKTLTTFQDTPRIPAFLLAIVISDLTSYGKGNVTLHVVPGKVRSIQKAGRYAPLLIKAMATHLGSPYPEIKNDLVALPFLGPVAMENWGLFTFREENVLYTEGFSKTRQLQSVPRFIAHEVAHAYVGNLVSIGWWDYLWVSEAFAMYYEYYLPTLVEPSWKMTDQILVDLHQLGLLQDSFAAAPLTTSILSSQQIIAKFSGVTYTKGPALLRMVINALSEKTFLRGIKKFLRSNSYSSTTPQEFWNAIDGKFFPAALNEIMYNWTSTSGYPVINVVKQNGSIQLTQTIFRLDDLVSDDVIRWWIPISFTTSRENKFDSTVPKFWFPPKASYQFDMPLPVRDWIIINIQSTGFYRVNYDNRNWRNIIGQLRTEHNKIHLLNRAQLIDDSMNLARSGRLPYNIALDLIQYIKYERRYVPWASASNALEYISNILYSTSIYRNFKFFMQALLENVFKEAGLTEKKGEGHLWHLAREIVVKWSCEMGVADCIQQSIDLIKSNMTIINDKKLGISPDVRETVLCTAVKEGGDREWLILSGQYEKATGDFKNQVIRALGCSKDERNIVSFLVGFDDIPEAEWYMRYRALIRKENAQLLLDFLSSNLSGLTTRYGVQNFNKYVGDLKDFLTIREQEAQIAQMEGNGANGLGNARSSILLNAAWIERYMPQLIEYFRRF